MALIAFQNLTFRYPGAGEPALDDVCLEVGQGSLLCLMGRSGCGKTTLVRQLKTALVPKGARSGRVLLNGADVDAVGLRDQARLVGYVGQDPDSQLVCDTVGRELAFGLENVGAPREEAAVAVAETASYFGLQELMDCPVAELSGGQKQLVNLAAVLALRPQVLVLDEPTSQLDPVAAGEFLATVRAVNDDLGLTVILVEQRLEAAFAMADQVVVMANGRVAFQGSPEEVAASLGKCNHELCRCLPSAARIALALSGGTLQPCPLTVREGRRWLEGRLGGCQVRACSAADPAAGTAESAGSARSGAAERPACRPALRLRDVWFRYGRDLPDVLRGLSLTVEAGQLFALVGGNGAGKSTLLSLACGLRTPYRGRVETFGNRCALLPQDPQALFSWDSVAQELDDMVGAGVAGAASAGGSGDSAYGGNAAVTTEEVAALCHLKGLLDRHPLDLSSGEQQRVALAKALLVNPSVLLLDEPTKGLDALFKSELGALLRRLAQRGLTVVAVSHDVEFCAEWADRAALLFDGAIVASGAPSQLFAASAFYTTAASRIARDAVSGAVTVEDVVSACRSL